MDYLGFKLSPYVDNMGEKTMNSLELNLEAIK